MKKENDIIAEAIEREAKERNLATNKRYKVILNASGEAKEQYFDTLSEAREYITDNKKEAAIFYKENTASSYSFVENVTF
jgi:vacuolar-type H+-ATPase subunit H